jgi:hypothetical protein
MFKAFFRRKHNKFCVTKQFFVSLEEPNKPFKITAKTVFMCVLQFFFTSLQLLPQSLSLSHKFIYIFLTFLFYDDNFLAVSTPSNSYNILFASINSMFMSLFINLFCRINGFAIFSVSYTLSSFSLIYSPFKMIYCRNVYKARLISYMISFIQPFHVWKRRVRSERENFPLHILHTPTSLYRHLHRCFFFISFCTYFCCCHLFILLCIELS